MLLNSLAWTWDKKCSQAQIVRPRICLSINATRIFDTCCLWLVGSYITDRTFFQAQPFCFFPYKYSSFLKVSSIQHSIIMHHCTLKLSHSIFLSPVAQGCLSVLASLADDMAHAAVWVLRVPFVYFWWQPLWRSQGSLWLGLAGKCCCASPRCFQSETW